MNRVPKSVRIISTLGLFPFFFGVLGTFQLNVFSYETNSFLIQTSIIYAGLILSFLGGCLFSFEILANSNPKRGQLWLAVLPAVWATISLQIPIFGASLMAIGFLIVLEIDRRTFKSGKTPVWWINLRFPLTFWVVLSLVVIGFYG